MKLRFNDWSKGKIQSGQKICTSRFKKYNDPRVKFIEEKTLGFVKNNLYREEGANSPEEFEKVWRSIFNNFDDNKIVFVHFGDFRE
jgi:hypothetical protein